MALEVCRRVTRRTRWIARRLCVAGSRHRDPGFAGTNLVCCAEHHPVFPISCESQLLSQNPNVHLPIRVPASLTLAGRDYSCPGIAPGGLLPRHTLPWRHPRNTAPGTFSFQNTDTREKTDRGES